MRDSFFVDSQGNFVLHSEADIEREAIARMGAEQWRMVKAVTRTLALVYGILDTSNPRSTSGIDALAFQLTDMQNAIIEDIGKRVEQELAQVVATVRAQTIAELTGTAPARPVETVRAFTQDGDNAVRVDFASPDNRLVMSPQAALTLAILCALHRAGGKLTFAPAEVMASNASTQTFFTVDFNQTEGVTLSLASQSDVPASVLKQMGNDAAEGFDAFMGRL